MICSGRILTVSHVPTPFYSSRSRCYHHGNLKSNLKWRSMASDDDASSFSASVDSDSSPDKNSSAFCIIEGPETVQDFETMELQEIQENIRSRRNKIFLQMEEFLEFFWQKLLPGEIFALIERQNCPSMHNFPADLEEEPCGRMVLSFNCVKIYAGKTLKEIRRLRIQRRLKKAELGIVKVEDENELPNFPSFIPFLPPLNSSNLKVYYATCFSLIAGVMLFGGLLAPALELKLGLGGTSYVDFIQSIHLPMQLSEVDPIVASFSGGAVGVISSLMVVEINNVKLQEHKRCKYCLGTGYLACARCLSTGSLILVDPVSTLNEGDRPLSPPKTERCSNCSGSGKVMCPTCLCTGMAMASEHDPRIDPFD